MAPEVADTAAGVQLQHRRRRVLLFPLPYQGHINPMFQLAGLLHARGFAVTVFHATFNAPDPSRHPAYHFVHVPDGLPPGTPATVAATVEHILALNAACEAPFRDRLAALLDAPDGTDDDDKVACLVADAHLLTIVDVARRQGVPTLVLRTGSAACFRNFMANPMLCDKGYLPAEESRLDEPVRELPPYRVRDLMGANSGSRREHDVSCELLSRAVEAVRASAGLVLNTFDALEADELAATRRDLGDGVPVFDVGPLHKLFPASCSSLLRQDRSCLGSLDAQAPASVLYISFGSLASMSGADLAEAAWGVAGSGQPFLWALRPGIAGGAALPDGFAAATEGRGMVVGWAPQEEVLAHGAVGGFWTHGGWNSTLEGACGGVPMIFRPCFGDQMGNARYVEHVWRAGIALDGGVLERGAVEVAVRRLMRSEEGEEMRRRARELGSSAAAAIADGGSSRRSVDKLVNHILSL